VEARSLLLRRAPDGPAVLEADRHRIARLEHAVNELKEERDELNTDLALARSWVRDLFSWIEQEETTAAVHLEPPQPGSLRRAATVAALVGAPWILFGGGVATGIALF
jgi:hypothetical protein